MVISIRGTSGSGKSFLVRRLMDGVWCAPEYLRRDIGLYGPMNGARPVGYDCRRDAVRFFVLGHYEVPTGGADRLLGSFKWTRDDLFGEVAVRAAASHVVFEGLLACEVHRTVRLASAHHVAIIHLITPLEECLSAIRDRRMARGDYRPLNHKATMDKMRELERQTKRLREAGVAVQQLDREHAYRACRELLGL